MEAPSSLSWRPWWERPGVLHPVRDATPDGCLEQTAVSTSCSTHTDPATGEPIRHCIKLYRRYLKCKGRCERGDAPRGPADETTGP